MEHTLLKAAITAVTDQGTFEAVISAESVDREKDVVSAAGMVRALQKWTQTGKKIPLAWAHSGAADQQIGWIDPASAKEVNGEVIANGWIDQAVDAGAHAWRLVKAGTLGFSFGYLILKGSKRKGGGRKIDELDVFEVTATPTPMNNDTRVIGWKADVPSEQLLNAMLGMAMKFIDQEDDQDDIDAMQDIADALKQLGAAEASEPDDSAEDGKSLRKRVDALALELVADGEPGQKVPEAKPDLPAGAEWLFPDSELKAIREGDLKAAWSAAMVNNLPDSSFLYIAPGGARDSDGKTTPRSLRYFPVKDDNGVVDLPHLRNALARIPQSDLSQTIKDELTAKAQRLLDAQKSVDVTGKERKSVRSVDPLRDKVNALALEVASDGESLTKPPQAKAAPKTPLPSPEELRESVRAATFAVLTGDIEP